VQGLQQSRASSHFLLADLTLLIGPRLRCDMLVVEERDAVLDRALLGIGRRRAKARDGGRSGDS